MTESTARQHADSDPNCPIWIVDYPHDTQANREAGVAILREKGCHSFKFQVEQSIFSDLTPLRVSGVEKKLCCRDVGLGLRCDRPAEHFGCCLFNSRVVMGPE